MDNKQEQNKDGFTYRIFQFAIWLVIIMLIIVRLINYETVSNDWIWGVNYIGMGLALINLLINKCFKLKCQNKRKYKPFVGFTVLVLVIICIGAIPIYICQKLEYSQSLNDIITLFALFFSLSDSIWDSILNKLVKILK